MTSKGISNINVGVIGFWEVGQVFANGLLEKTNHVYIEGTEKVHFFQNDNIVIKKRASRIASKARFLLKDTFKYTKKSLVFRKKLLFQWLRIHLGYFLEKSGNLLAQKISEIGVTLIANISFIGSECNIIFSLVTSSASEVVASNIASTISDGTIFVDFTTSTPQVKKRSEQIIASSGGTYVDGAIMGTVSTDQYNAPLLIAGKQSDATMDILNALGLNCQKISQPNGSAASIKLLRSIFTKGLEALIFETMITAEKYEVLDEVMKSISNTIDNNDFEKYAHALIKTHVTHPQRRKLSLCEGAFFVVQIIWLGSPNDV